VSIKRQLNVSISTLHYLVCKHHTFNVLKDAKLGHNNPSCKLVPLHDLHIYKIISDIWLLCVVIILSAFLMETDNNYVVGLQTLSLFLR